MAHNKRYTDGQAVRLLGRLITVADLPVTRARRLVGELLAARLGDVVVTEAAQTVAAESDATIAMVQTSVAGYLQIAAVTDPPAWRPLTLTGVTLTMTRPDDLRLEVSGPLHKMLTVQIYGLLRRVGDRLRVCECGRLYVRVRRQAFCSERCQKRVYMRRFRAGAPLED